MPSTLLGLLVFTVLLAPGLIYLSIQERRAPEVRRSIFRETAVVTVASITADIAALAVFSLLRFAAPGLTPDIGALVREPGAYLRGHYVETAWWGVAMLALAVGFGWLAGRTSIAESHPSRMSAWWVLFSKHPEARVFVGCVLDDKSFVSGWLHSYSAVADDIADRDLTITEPIHYRPPGETNGIDLEDVGAATINARNIVLMTVSYISRS